MQLYEYRTSFSKLQESNPNINITEPIRFFKQVSKHKDVSGQNVNMIEALKSVE